MKLKIHYYKPRSTSVLSTTVQVGDITAKSTLVTQRDRKTAISNIPMSPKIHLKTFIDLSLYSSTTRNSSLLPVTLYLVANLTDRNKQDVCVKVEDIINDLQVSDKSVTKAINILEEKQLLSRQGRSKFRLSPKLAFFGEPFDWSIALQYEAEGDEFIQNKLVETHAQIQEADSAILSKIVESGIPKYSN